MNRYLYQVGKNCNKGTARFKWAFLFKNNDGLKGWKRNYSNCIFLNIVIE